MKYGFIREIEGIDSIIEQAKKLENYGVEYMLPEFEDDNTLETIINRLGEGDELVVNHIYILGMGLTLFDILKELERKKIRLTILNQ